MKVYETSQLCTNVLASGLTQEEQKGVELEYIMIDPENIEMTLEDQYQMQEQEIEFNGMTFTLENQVVKFCKFSEKATIVLQEYKSNIMKYLQLCKEVGLELQKKDGMIMVADDQFVVQQVMRVFFNELGILGRVLFCNNGEEVLEFFKGFFSQLEDSTIEKDKKGCVRPITLLLMDINMPFKNGLETT